MSILECKTMKIITTIKKFTEENLALLSALLIAFTASTAGAFVVFLALFTPPHFSGGARLLNAAIIVVATYFCVKAIKINIAAAKHEKTT